MCRADSFSRLQRFAPCPRRADSIPARGAGCHVARRCIAVRRAGAMLAFCARRNRRRLLCGETTDRRPASGAEASSVLAARHRGLCGHLRRIAVPRASAGERRRIQAAASAKNAVSARALERAQTHLRQRTRWRRARGAETQHEQRGAAETRHVSSRARMARSTVRASQADATERRPLWGAIAVVVLSFVFRSPVSALPRRSYVSTIR